MLYAFTSYCSIRFYPCAVIVQVMNSIMQIFTDGILYYDQKSVLRGPPKRQCLFCVMRMMSASNNRYQIVLDQEFKTSTSREYCYTTKSNI